MRDFDEDNFESEEHVFETLENDGIADWEECWLAGEREARDY